MVFTHFDFILTRYFTVTSGTEQITAWASRTGPILVFNFICPLDEGCRVYFTQRKSARIIGVCLTRSGTAGIPSRSPACHLSVCKHTLLQKWPMLWDLTFKIRASYIYRKGVPLPSKCCILYIFSTNISTEYFKHAAHSPFFSSNCRLFHNAIFFGSCFIHILHTRCAKF